ncbi:MAG: sulfotransferase domain-containing protein [Bacteroidetes bacterium]|nr:sulfotransferase domain-containing protein [Bacteroidota bacterium]
MLNTNAKFIWLASYPKSGNTWVRIFLSALLTGKEPDINNLETNLIISNRQLIDSTLGFSSSDIPDDDYLPYRTQMYEAYARAHKQEYILCKVHDACTLKGKVLFTPAITRGTVYILRNPFDMVASTANHHNVSIEQALDYICSSDHALANRRTKLNSQVSQHMGTWSQHLQSWENVHHQNMLLVKYEDLVNNSQQAFSRIAAYINIPHTDAEVAQAIANAAFQKLQNQEQKSALRMAPHVKQFFRSGKVGGWRNEITTDQATRIIDCNYDALLKYGYIDNAGNILV